MLSNYMFVEHCVIQTNRWADCVFRTTLESPETFKEDLSAPSENLIKHVMALHAPNIRKECKVKKPEDKSCSLKSLTLPVQQQQHKKKYLAKTATKNSQGKI